MRSLNNFKNVFLSWNNHSNDVINRGGTGPMLIIKMPPSSSTLTPFKNLSMGKNPLRMIPPIGSMSFENFQARILARDSSTGVATTIVRKTPFFGTSPDRYPGLLNVVLEGSRIKGRENAQLFLNALEAWSIKDWISSNQNRLNENDWISTCFAYFKNQLLSTKGGMFVTFLFIGFTVWWIHLPEIFAHVPNDCLNPDWVNSIRERVVDSVRSDGQLSEEAVREAADHILRKAKIYQYDPLDFHGIAQKTTLAVFVFSFIALGLMHGAPLEIPLNQ